GTFLLLQACAAQSQLVQDELLTVTKENLRYYLYYPEGYFSSGGEFGLLLFLHGGGESGREIEEVRKNGPRKLLAEGKQFPLLILAPQNPHEMKWWNTQAVVQLLDSIVETNRVDKNRVYLTGLSRGGSAAWELATQYPQKFAALAVVCGMAPLPYAHWIDKNMALWVFLRDEAVIVGVEEAHRRVSDTREHGSDVRDTRDKNSGHNDGARAYTADSLYTRIAKQKRIN